MARLNKDLFKSRRLLEWKDLVSGMRVMCTGCGTRVKDARLRWVPDEESWFLLSNDLPGYEPDDGDLLGYRYSYCLGEPDHEISLKDFMSDEMVTSMYAVEQVCPWHKEGRK